jgi:mannose-6-phosphate isomerase-like protein (cupin superfamily)
MGNITGKVWGDTSVIIQNPLVELHKINIKAGYKCSEHKHVHKWNGFYVISGTLEIHVRKNNYELTDVTTLRAGDFTTVSPGEFHWFNCISDCVALELYYPESLSEDIVRKSVGGRTTTPSTTIEKLNSMSGQVTMNTTGLENINYPDLKTYAYTVSSVSPCCNICDIDPMTNKCRGCDRTPEQIQAYGLSHMPEGYNK